MFFAERIIAQTDIMITRAMTKMSQATATKKAQATATKKAQATATKKAQATATKKAQATKSEQKKMREAAMILLTLRRHDMA
jgi:membrane protein involved in colicin uptake